MKYFSMFSGIGGFEYGINEAYRQLLHKPQCVGFSEIDKYAKQIYLKHYGKGVCIKNEEQELPRIGDQERQCSEQFNTGSKGFNDHNTKEHKDYGDCTKIKWEEVEDFDVLVGGFPCQAFSIAGKRGGFNDTRGTLFFEIARCLREKQPRLCVLENVKGLLSHNKGQTFATILTTLDELGYDAEWQVLNSKNFGVPQNRERVFIIGHLRGTGGGQVFPIGQISEKSIQKFPQDSGQKCAWALRQRDYKDGTNFWSNEQNTQKTGIKSNDTNIIRRTSYSDGMRIRRLTPTECERLQGFPDGWTEGISDTQRYKCLGNAVTTNVITAIFRRIYETQNRS